VDELPQLFNVLRGDMSLVGPRPLPDYHVEELDPALVKLRERVRPGVTGMWQVSGRSAVGTAGMERFDGYYVRNWSVWLDAVILVRTFKAVIRGSGAY
jgi:lipopolysaccharide/colanic/teichoic acid biosynthesis glycosyltransferase